MSPDQHPTERSDPIAVRILGAAIALVTLVALGLAVLLALDGTSGTPVVVLHVLIGAVGAMAWRLFRQGHLRASATLLLAGYWTGVTAVAAINGGLRGPNLLNYPLILVVSGWLLGTAQTIAFAILTELVFIAFLVADLYGLVPPADYGNLKAYFLFLTGITLMTATATILSRRAYLARIAESQRIAADLAQREEELRRHRDRLEDEVRERTRELEYARDVANAASRAKSVFIANMSHEIRTPLNAVLGLSHLLRSDATPQQLSRLDKIHSAGQHLLSIVNDVLDLSKIESGKLTLEEEDFSLSEVLDQVATILAEQATAKGLTFAIENPLPFDALRGDPGRLRQILLNFVGNAIKFTAHGGIVLRVRTLSDAPASEAEIPPLRFEVQDTGIGIAPETLARLFKAFEQGDARTSRQHGGSGLGLSISRRLAQLMGGEVGAESTMGLGSVFWVTVCLRRARAPVVRVPVNAADAANALRQQQAGKRILLAEDNPINREVATELLVAAGFTVDAAHDGQQAIALAKGHHYDIVLMDMQMPEVDGCAACRAIRQLPGWQEIPILAMSANALPEDRSLCREAGMNDFIVKPVDPPLLYGQLTRWLAGSPGLDAPSRLDAPSAAPMDLGDLPGVDADVGLKMVGGRAGFYADLLARFVATHAGDPAALEAHMTSGRWDDAARLAHTLKGSAGMLGATGVQQLASEIESLFRQSPAPTALPHAQIASIASALNALGDALARRAARTPPGSR